VSDHKHQNTKPILPQSNTDLVCWLYFIFAAFLPFSKLGPELADKFWITPSLLAGVILLIISLSDGVLSKLLIVSGVMIGFFILTAVYRNPVSSYIFSLGAFALVISPLLIRRISPTQSIYLKRGFLAGLYTMLAIIFFEVAVQVLSLDRLHLALTDLMGTTESATSFHNNRFGYARPHATFSEPAYVAMFLFLSLLVIDVGKFSNSGFLRIIIYAAIFITGSLVGYVLLVVYFFISAFLSGVTIRVTTKSLVFSAIGFFAFASTALYLDSKYEITETLAIRAKDIGLAIRYLSLEGSEASRINSFLIYVDYFAQADFTQLLFGEGYGSQDVWILENYSYMGAFASASSGRVDNIYVALLISVGLTGFVVYNFFLITLVAGIQTQNKLRYFMMLVVFQFASGFLLWYVIWHTFAIMRLLSHADHIEKNTKMAVYPTNNLLGMLSE
jgi:hypothetical protein